MLEAFDGTILLVSHDRYLVDRLARHIWSLEDGKLVTYPATYQGVPSPGARETAGLAAGDRQPSKTKCSMTVVVEGKRRSTATRPLAAAEKPRGWSSDARRRDERRRVRRKRQSTTQNSGCRRRPRRWKPPAPPGTRAIRVLEAEVWRRVSNWEALLAEWELLA